MSDTMLDLEMDKIRYEDTDFSFVCYYCGNKTRQSPVIFDVREFDEYTKDDYIIYPSCCGRCCTNEIWRSICLNDCDKEILDLSFYADEQSIQCAKIQEAYDRICMKHNMIRPGTN